MHFVKVGVVASPAPLNNKLDTYEQAQDYWVRVKASLLKWMQASTVRVGLRTFNADRERFTAPQLDILRDALRPDAREMILQSREDITVAAMNSELPFVKSYAAANPGVLFVYELGNEPDQHAGTNPIAARDNLIACLKALVAQRNAGGWPSNLIWGFNMPSDGASDGYIQSFLSANGNGESLLQTSLTYLVTVHCYSDNEFIPKNPGDNFNPYRLVSAVRSRNATINIKVTEAGIGAGGMSDYDRGTRYRRFVDDSTNETYDPNIDSICFHAAPEVDDVLFYNITYTTAGTITNQVPKFSDVPVGHPYFDAIHSLAALNIAQGYQGGSFGPGNSLLRQEMAAFIARSMPAGGNPGDTTMVPGFGPNTWAQETWNDYTFTDLASADPALRQSIRTTAHYGVSRGYADGRYGPLDPVTFAQMIAFTVRAMVAKGYWTPQPGAAQPFAGVPAVHDVDVRTYAAYLGAASVPVPPTTESGWSQAANRGWIAQILWNALKKRIYRLL